MKKRVLVVTEATFLNTGYAIYAKELITRLRQLPDFEVAELSCYAQPPSQTDQRILSIPWTAYAVMPDQNNAEEKAEYEANIALNQFGMWKFEAACNHFRPHYVLTFRDWWMDSWIANSPFRRYFKWIILAACDALKQNEEWLETYKNADGLLTYNDWSGKTLLEQCNHLIWDGSAPHVPNIAFQTMDKALIKERLGLKPDTRIIGTVMRNQRRKLFPDLFDAFRQYLDLSGHTNTFLYCHTSYPDSWDFPELLKQYKLGSKVLFTYVCEHCKYVFPSFFADMVTFCRSCGNLSANMSSVHTGASEEILSAIYNTFDLYVQYANSEGLGMPQIEAAACGIPVMAINYSAMEDVITKLQGIPLPYKSLTKELETGCMRAVPDNEATAQAIKNFFDLPQEERQRLSVTVKINQMMNYNWENTVATWIKAINRNPIDYNIWDSPPNIHNIATVQPNPNMDNKQYARWLIVEVLGQPERLDTYLEHRLVRDLNFNRHYGVWHGMYFNEMSEMFYQRKPQQFTRQNAYDHMKMLGEKKNYMEKVRCSL